MTTLSRRQRQKVERREAILLAAREVFLAGNLHTATVETVARTANISKGTVYLYFSSKEALLAELLREGLHSLGTQLAAAYAEDEVLTPDVRIARLAGAYLEFAEDQPAYIQLMFAFEGGQLDLSDVGTLTDEIVTLGARGVELVAKAVRQGINQKAFRRVDTHRVAGALWAALNGALLTGWDKAQSKIVKRNVETLFQVSLELYLRALKRDQA